MIEATEITNANYLILALIVFAFIVFSGVKYIKNTIESLRLW